MNSEKTYPYELPQGWVWANLSEVANLIRGVSYPKEESSKQAKDGYIPILRANNIDGELNFNELIYVPRKRVDDEQLVKAFDILIAMSSGSKALVGKASQANCDFDGGFGAFCGLVRVAQELERKYAGFFFQSPNYRSEISRLSSGVNINNLRRDHIESMPIPLPPLSEQHRIVAKIEELFTKLDAGVEALKKIKAQLKRYRQSVLKHAFEGKLTQEWRQAHKDEPEPASVLLGRIKQERCKTAKGKYKELPPLDNSNLPELPEGWVWVCIGIAVEKIPLTGKKLKQSEYQETGLLPVVDQGQTFIGGYTDRRELRAPCVPPVVIFGDHTKVIKYVNFDFVAGADGVKAMKPLNIFYPKLFYYFLQAIELPEKGYARHFQFLESSFVPVPPFPEQHRIVSEIERRFSVADQIEKTVDKGLKQAERLRQSILKRAFEGKLVPQDPSDEPAEKLLERIKEERARHRTEDRSRRKNRTSTAVKQMRLA